MLVFRGVTPFTHLFSAIYRGHSYNSHFITTTTTTTTPLSPSKLSPDQLSPMKSPLIRADHPIVMLLATGIVLAKFTSHCCLPYSPPPKKKGHLRVLFLGACVSWKTDRQQPLQVYLKKKKETTPNNSWCLYQIPCKAS